MLPTQTLRASQLISAEQGHGGTLDILSIPLLTDVLLSGPFGQIKPISKSRGLLKEGVLRVSVIEVIYHQSYRNI